ncbi:MAG: hypothetical protein HY922_10480 [Elusimicrobia bacterium]|nr:hypothetical protein [Elusimicrobiota bacterium]
MSAVCVFTPVVMEMAWPLVSSIAASALVSLGYQVVQQEAAQEEQEAGSSVDLEVSQSHGFEETLGEEEKLVVQKGEVTLTMKKGAEGKLHICAAGKGISEAELKAAGTEAMNRFLQAYVRKKVGDELKKRGFAFEEETLPGGAIRLRAKKW